MRNGPLGSSLITDVGPAADAQVTLALRVGLVVGITVMCPRERGAHTRPHTVALRARTIVSPSSRFP